MTDDTTPQLTTASRFEELLSAFDKLQQQLMDEGQDLFKSWFSSVLSNYPEVKTVEWIQYTPWFSDGDECLFTFSPLNFNLQDDEGIWDGEIDYREDLKNKPGLVDFAEKFLSMPPFLLEHIFSNHVHVRYVVEEDDFEIETYDHD